jgi:hypothetical protein
LAKFFELLKTFVGDLLDLRILSSGLFGDVSLQAGLLSCLDFSLVNHGVVDLKRVQLEVEVTLVDDGLYEGSQGLLKILETLLSSVVSDDHLGDHGVRTQEVGDLLDNADFVLNGQLEKLQDEEFLTRSEGISVKGENGSLKETFHLLSVHQEQATSEVTRLGLEQVEEILVVLNLSRVTGEVLNFNALLAALHTARNYIRKEESGKEHETIDKETISR